MAVVSGGCVQTHSASINTEIITMSSIVSLPVCVCSQLLMVIGGGMEQFDDINGIVVSRRKRGDRIALWTRTRSREASQKVW